MTTKDINKARNANGVFAAGNEAAGWFAVSRDGVNMITFYQGKWTSAIKGDVIRFYTEQVFAKKITKLLNGTF
jgi:hypothetical protein